MKNDSDVMDNIPSRPIGERFNFGDVVLEVVADVDFTYGDCTGCYFYECIMDIRGYITCYRNCEAHASFIGHCYYESREDGEDVIFRQVE